MEKIREMQKFSPERHLQICQPGSILLIVGLTLCGNCPRRDRGGARENGGDVISGGKGKMSNICGCLTAAHPQRVYEPP